MKLFQEPRALALQPIYIKMIDIAATIAPPDAQFVTHEDAWLSNLLC